MLTLVAARDGKVARRRTLRRRQWHGVGTAYFAAAAATMAMAYTLASTSRCCNTTCRRAYGYEDIGLILTKF